MAQPKDLWSRQFNMNPSSYRFGLDGTGSSTGGTNPNQGVINPGQTAPGSQGPQWGSPNVNINNQNGNGHNSLLNSLMSPDALAALGMGGMGLLQGVMQNRSNAQQSDANRGLDRQKMLLDMLSGQQTDARGRDTAYLNSFAMDPVGQQQDIFHAAALRTLAQNGAPRVSPGQVSNVPDFGGVANQYLGDNQLASAASRFYGAQTSMSDTAATPSLDALGFGPAGAAAQGGMDAQVSAARGSRNQLTQQQQAALNPVNSANSAAPAPEKKKGSPWWKKALKIAAMAAPIVAAPFTGGSSLALIGALSGAGAGALDNGWKGAALGALGAIPMGGGGLAKNAAKPALKAGLTAAAKKAGPNLLTSYLMNGQR